MAGADRAIVERLDHLEPGEHAVDAVEFATGRLRVEVASGHDHGQRIVAAASPDEQVADGVHPDRAACLLRPARKELAALKVEVRQGLTIAAAMRRGADLRHRHEARPEAFAADARRVVDCVVQHEDSSPAGIMRASPD